MTGVWCLVHLFRSRAHYDEAKRQKAAKPGARSKEVRTIGAHMDDARNALVQLRVAHSSQTGQERCGKKRREPVPMPGGCRKHANASQPKNHDSQREASGPYAAKIGVVQNRPNRV